MHGHWRQEGYEGFGTHGIDEVGGVTVRWDTSRMRQKSARTVVQGRVVAVELEVIDLRATVE